jgi:7,8-dihydropterin-6-yl-methyl-4-(beta-D-ribofuranosyl)aminobenzene 5'-phosphate synthase
MKVTVLYDNQVFKQDLIGGHGLSVHIELNQHNILVDTGLNPDFIKNAQALGIDLKSVTHVVISHGHYDHTGGLAAFMDLNPTAEIIIHKKAFERFMNTKSGTAEYIGIDPAVTLDGRFTLMDAPVELFEGALVFPGKIGTRYLPKGNQTLFVEREGKLVPDTFVHEIALMVSQADKKLLVSGCSHGGIVNILEKAKTIEKTGVTHVLAGLHLRGIDPENIEDKAFLDGLQKDLVSTGIDHVYTCHCTGTSAGSYLSQHPQFSQIEVGSTIEIK